MGLEPTNAGTTIRSLNHLATPAMNIDLPWKPDSFVTLVLVMLTYVLICSAYSDSQALLSGSHDKSSKNLLSKTTLSDKTRFYHI